MIVEVSHQTIGIVSGCVGFCAGRAEAVTKDQSGSNFKNRASEHSPQQGSKSSNFTRNPVKRTNIDEAARYVVEGLTSRKQKMQDHQSGGRTGHH